MLVTVSTALILALAAGALVHFQRATPGAAFVLWLSGFTAATVPGVAGPVNDLLNAAVHAIGH